MIEFDQQDHANDDKLDAKRRQGQQGADVCGRQRRQEGDRVNVALAQHAEEKAGGGNRPQGSSIRSSASAC